MANKSNLFLIIFFAMSSCFVASAMQMNKEELNKQLIQAVKHKNLESVKRLIEAGADVNAKDKYDWTLLMKASVGECQDSITTSLLNAGARVNEKTRYGRTALQGAASEKCMTCCRLLVDQLLRIPNDKQRKRLYTFLICLKRWHVPSDIQRYFKPFLLDAIEKENRKYFKQSVAYQEMWIIDRSMKTKLLEKYDPMCVIL